MVDEQQPTDGSCDMLQIDTSEIGSLKGTSNYELVSESIKGTNITLFKELFTSYTQ